MISHGKDALYMKSRPRRGLTLMTDDLLDALSVMQHGLLVVGRDRRVLYANRTALHIMRVDEDVFGLDLQACGLLDPNDDMWHGLELVLAGGTFPPLERTIGEATYRLQMARTPRGAVIALHDITREHQEARQRDTLISMVSHELRTPLASIKGYTTTLLRKDVTWDAQTQREFLEVIDTESDRLRELLDSLLDMSKLEAGGLHLERLPVQLGRVARRAVQGLRMTGGRHQVMLSFPRDLPLVECDPRRIEQVVRNLVENAIKYSPDGGKITIQGLAVHSPEQIPGAQPTCPFAVVSVSDSGPGIANEDLDQLFERFRRLGPAGANVSGSGLGLSICKGIVEAHGGSIWARSELNKGTTISFALPLC
jgi:signal transduction histidine kinase